MDCLTQARIERYSNAVCISDSAAERRHLAVELLRKRFAEVVESGLGLIVKLPDGVDDLKIVHAAREQNLAPSALSAWYLQTKLARNGLLLSVTNLRPDNIRAACAALEDVVSARISQRRGVDTSHRFF